MDTPIFDQLYRDVFEIMLLRRWAADHASRLDRARAHKAYAESDRRLLNSLDRIAGYRG